MSGAGWERLDGPEDAPPVERAQHARSGTAAAPGEPYRPLRGRARWLSALLLLGIVMDLVAVGSGLGERSLLNDAASGGLVTAAEANASDMRQTVVGGLQGAVFVVTAVAFLFWFYRAYRNLTALGVSDLRFRYGWAVGGWFVPILNLWRPKQIANDIWRESEPTRLDEAGLWERPGRVPPWHLAWWLAYLAMGSLYSLASRRSRRAIEIPELLDANSLFLAGDVLGVVAGALALLVVRRTTARQTALAAELGLVLEDDPRPLWRRRSAWAALVAVVIGFGFQAAIRVALWSGALDTGEQQSEPLPRTPRATPPGTLFADDFSRRGVWLLHHDRSLTFDYSDGAYRIVVKEEAGMWSSLQTLPKETRSISVEVEMRLHAGRTRTDFYGLECVASSGGGYLFGISPDGYYTVGFDPGGDDVLDLKRLVEEYAARPFGSDEEPNRVRAECRREGAGTVLVLSVNGVRLAETTHRRSLGDFAGVGLFAYSGNGGTDVRFDDLVVRELR